MNSTNGQLTITIASLPDRDKLVAELWSGDAQIAELSQEHGTLVLELYPPATGGDWAFPYEEFAAALHELRFRLAE